MNARDVFVVDAVRTPIGKHGGALKDVRPDDLAAHVIRALVERVGIEPAAIDDIYFGAGNQAGEDNRNVARMAALLAGLPVEVAGVTVNRLCGSGLQAFVSAAREIQVGAVDVAIAGGVESMTRAPLVIQKLESGFARGNQTAWDTTLGWRMVNPRLAELYHPYSLGETAENVAKRYGISREDQDELALASHRKAIAAHESCHFQTEIVAIDVPRPRGASEAVCQDEGPRADTSRDKLAALRPAFVADGTVTAGNSSQISDGSAALLLASGAALARHGLRPLARFVDATVAGVDPALMGMGPVPATRKLLDRTGIKLHDVEVVELNEAFAAQVLACVQELGIELGRLNPNGGAIALGHPIGMSGARLATTLVHEMARQGAHLGLATMCIGVGQGISAIFERVED